MPYVDIIMRIEDEGVEKTFQDLRKEVNNLHINDAFVEGSEEASKLDNRLQGVVASANNLNDAFEDAIRKNYGSKILNSNELKSVNATILETSRRLEDLKLPFDDEYIQNLRTTVSENNRLIEQYQQESEILRSAYNATKHGIMPAIVNTANGKSIDTKLSASGFDEQRVSERQEELRKQIQETRNSLNEVKAKAVDAEEELQRLLSMRSDNNVQEQIAQQEKLLQTAQKTKQEYLSQNSFEKFVPDDSVVSPFIEKMETLATCMNTVSNDVTDLNNRFQTINDDHIVEVTNRMAELESQIETVQQENETLNEQGFGVGYTQYDQNLTDLQDLQNEYRQLSQEVQDYTDRQRNATEERLQFSRNLGIQMNAGEMDEGLRETLTSLREVEEEIQNVTQRQQELENANRGLGYEEYDSNLQVLRELQEEYAELREEVVAYRNAQAGISDDVERVSNSTSGARNSVQMLINSFKLLRADVRDTFNSIKNGVKNLISLFKRFGKTAISAINSVVSSVKRLSSGMKELIQHTKKNTEHLEKMGLRTLKALIGVRGLFALIRKIKSAMKEGLGNVGLFDENEANQARELTAQFLQIKNALGAILAPIRDALIPLITQLSRHFVDAANSVAMFFSALTGKDTAIIAKYLDADIVKQQEDEKATKKNNKEKQKQLSKLDILNNLTSKEDTEDDESKVAKLMFETVEISDKVKDIIDKLKHMWSEGDFTELGDLIGNKLKKALESIPWNKIRTNARKAGKAIATFINGLVRVKDLGYTIGKTFAEGLNTIFEFIYGFVHNLDWPAVGKFIAETFNGWFENIDWSLIEATIIEGFEGLAKAINSFVQNFHWDNLSTFISNAVNILVDGIYNFLMETDFATLFYNLGDQIAKTIDKIDWYDVGETIRVAIGKVLESIVAFVRGLSNGDYEQAWTDFITGLDPMAILEALISIFNSAIDMFRDWIGDKDSWMDTGAKVGEALSTLIEDIDWHDVGGALSQLLSNAIHFLIGVIKGDENGEGGIDWQGVTDAIGDFFAGLSEDKELNEVMTNLAIALASLLSMKLGLHIGGMLISNAVKGALLKSILGGAGVTAGGVATSGGTMWLIGDAIVTGLVGAIIAGLAGFAGKEIIKKKFEGLEGEFNENRYATLEERYKGIGGAINYLKDAASGAGQKVKGVFDGMPVYIDGVSTSFDVLDQALSKIEKGYTYTTEQLEIMRTQMHLSEEDVETITQAMYDQNPALERLMALKGQDADITKETIAEAEHLKWALKDIENGTISSRAELEKYCDKMERSHNDFNLSKEGMNLLTGEITNHIIAEQEMQTAVDDTGKKIIDLGDILKENGEPAFQEMTEIAYDEAGNMVVKYGQGMIDGSETAKSDAKTAATNVYAGFNEGQEEEAEKTSNWWTNFWGGLIDFLKEKFKTGSPSKVMDDLGKNVMLGFFNGLQSVSEKLRTWVSNLVTFITNAFSNLSSRVSNTLSNISNRISNAKALAGNISVGGYVGRKLRGYASGQVIPPTMQEHIALLGDNKRETEVVSPLSTMKQAMIEALSESGFGGSDRPIVVEIDGKQVFSVTRDYANDYKKRTGNYAFG